MYVTSPKIDERLMRETQRDLALHVERIANRDEWVVSGRGQLHLSILIENMRRESYEFQVSRPRVIERMVDGVLKEPYEHVWIDVEHEHVGAVMEYCGERNGELLDMKKTDTRTKLTYEMPSRNLIGFMTGFRTLTKGYGVVSHAFSAYEKKHGAVRPARKTGALAASCDGVATHYALAGLEDRGVMFIAPKTEVYEGMVVGEHNKPNDLAVNVTKKKKLTNVRAAAKDDTLVLKQYRDMDLEACLDFIDDDEVVEVTPTDIRMRKTILNTKARQKSDNS
jgi:GTP-binding protein